MGNCCASSQDRVRSYSVAGPRSFEIGVTGSGMAELEGGTDERDFKESGKDDVSYQNPTSSSSSTGGSGGTLKRSNSKHATLNRGVSER
jgi:hypothetical protein